MRSSVSSWARPDMPTLGAVDLSSWTAPELVDWPALADRGVRLALVRAADGVTPDVSCARHVALARRAGVPAALWTFFRPSLSAAAQAAELARATRAVGADGVPWLDVEKSGGIGPAATREAIRRCLWAVDDLLGRRAGIYTGPSFWTRYLQGAATPGWLEPRALWIAHYGVDRPTIPGPWTSATIWQYAGNVAIGRAIVDLDELLEPLDRVLAGEPVTVPTP